jgi:phage terminase small subunit
MRNKSPMAKMNIPANAKRARFAHAILSGHTGKQAAILAGYSAATAATAACRLLKHPAVKAEITRLKTEHAKSEPHYATPLEFLMAVASGTAYATPLRIRAAKALLPYMHSPK